MICNDPLRKRRVTYSHAWWNGAFTDVELKHIQNFCDELEPEKAMTIGNENIEEIEKIRKSEISFFSRQDSNFWIFDRLNQVIDNINKQFFDFDLYGYETCQYTVYDSSYEGKYDWHVDINLGDDFLSKSWEKSTRKLSIVLLLNEPEKDFTGGELEIHFGKEEKSLTLPMQKGTIMSFPSFMAHRVKPVLSGVRKSLVIWVEGPKFK